MHPIKLLTRVLTCAAFALPLLATAPARSDAPAASAAPADASNATWDLSDLYATPQAWDESYARTKAAADKLGHYKGTLGTSPTNLLKALIAMSDLNREVARLTIVNLHYPTRRHALRISVAVDYFAALAMTV